MQIEISPKTKKILITIAVVVVLGILFFAFRPHLAEPAAGPAGEMSPDARAAVEGARAFYTLDYTAAPDLWALQVCAWTTEAGCQAAETFFAPSVAAMVQEHQVQTGCTVTPVSLVEDRGEIHVWLVNVTLTDPWAGLDTSSQDVYVEVERAGGNWLMNRILFEQEAVRFPTATP